MSVDFNESEFEFQENSLCLTLIEKSMKTIVYAIGKGLPKSTRTDEALESLLKTKHLISNAYVPEDSHSETVSLPDQFEFDLDKPSGNDLRFPSFIHLIAPEVGF